MIVNECMQVSRGTQRVSENNRISWGFGQVTSICDALARHGLESLRASR